jgi:hypothetical protein
MINVQGWNVTAGGPEVIRNCKDGCCASSTLHCIVQNTRLTVSDIRDFPCSTFDYSVTHKTVRLFVAMPYIKLATAQRKEHIQW